LHFLSFLLFFDSYHAFRCRSIRSGGQFWNNPETRQQNLWLL
jgi:hypothetical protein